MFDTVLIANRGEIALRVARTCRELGIRTVAVYSTADRDGAVVRLADEAVQIGPPPAKRSYLFMPAIIEAARSTGADAIHPGYGFLSEDPDFAEVCAAEGITFVGPPPALVQRLGDKAAARKIFADLGLAALPGSEGPVDGVADAKQVAERVGYPLIVKAVAGGGGRGMRIVEGADELVGAFQAARAEAQAVFGDNRVYIERYLDSARHVEIQVLCDGHGNGVHLGERDCSVQRRRQKLIEETPAPSVPSHVTGRIGEAAVRAALALGYTGLGTFEFVVDDDDEFHFMEMNCRIQVEHPVTEMVTGIDLVREQIKVAAGSALELTQADVARSGVAMECRINAEDPTRSFVPTPGSIERFETPGGPFTRVDTHVYPGWRVGPDYDSLLAKQIVWAPDRDQALARMDRALDEFAIEGPGICTTVGFLRDVLAHPLFAGGKHRTSLVDQMLETPG